jgi:hypothetical protein
MGKRKRDPLEDYFLAKFKEMGIDIIPPKNRHFKTRARDFGDF